MIVARLSPEFTAAVVDRWQELEEGQSVSVPRSLPEALRPAADLAEQKEQLTIQLAAAAPKWSLLIVIALQKAPCHSGR